MLIGTATMLVGTQKKQKDAHTTTAHSHRRASTRRCTNIRKIYAEDYNYVEDSDDDNNKHAHDDDDDCEMTGTAEGEEVCRDNNNIGNKN